MTNRSKVTQSKLTRSKSGKKILLANPKLQRLFSLERSSSIRSSII